MDRRGASWSVEGELEALELSTADGQVTSRAYPDALGRVWSALSGSRSGDVLATAATGFEFLDWGGAGHIGGGSHGSLHRGDSLGVLILCGTEEDDAEPERQWKLEDVTPLVLRHFGLNA